MTLRRLPVMTSSYFCLSICRMCLFLETKFIIITLITARCLVVHLIMLRPYATWWPPIFRIPINSSIMVALSSLLLLENHAPLVKTVFQMDGNLNLSSIRKCRARYILFPHFSSTQLNSPSLQTLWTATLMYVCLISLKKASNISKVEWWLAYQRDDLVCKHTSCLFTFSSCPK